MWTRDNLDAPYAPETETVSRRTALLYGGLLLLWTCSSLIWSLLF